MVAEHGKPVAVAVNASRDPRFQLFKDLPEDRFEAFLSVPVMCRGRVVGVINLQNREPHEYTEREIMLISTIGFSGGSGNRDGSPGKRKPSPLGKARNAQASRAREGDSPARTKAHGRRGLPDHSAPEPPAPQSMKEVSEAIVLSEDVKRGLSE